MSAGDDASELCRVRHTFTGLYVARGCDSGKRREGHSDSLRLSLDKQANSLMIERKTAEKLADVWIALTDDHGIEIEPVEG